MKAIDQITACVVDHGLYLPLARKLAQSYGRVLYHSQWERSYPTINECCIGDGFPDIERCDDVWKVKDEVDLFIFPDILNSGMQAELRQQGFPVWGSGDGDQIETNRLKFLELLQESGMTLPTVKEIWGVNGLRQHLRDQKDKYIKLSRYRGTMETWHWRDWSHDSGRLDSLAVTLGGLCDLIRFLVFDAIETDIEIGGDTYCIDGKFPSHLLEAYEWKDKSAFGAFKPRSEIAPPIAEVLQAFGPILGRYPYRNYFSMELRVKDDTSYFIDPCCRGPMPMTCSQMEIYQNLPEIIAAGAEGELVNPIPAGQFCCECILSTKAKPGEWATMTVPEELTDCVKLSHCCLADGTHLFPCSESTDSDIGWLVSIGDTPRETLDLMLSRAEQLPDGIQAATDSLVGLLQEIKEAESQGLELSSQPTPEPEEAI